MANLYLLNRTVDSVFQLLGNHENDMSYSLAWALSRCQSFLRAFLSKVGCRDDIDVEGVTIRLQRSEKGKQSGGITDIEIEATDMLHIIVEAKKGWSLPDRTQLKKYANRKSFRSNSARFKRIVALTGCRHEYAIANLDDTQDLGVAVVPISWDEVASLAHQTRAHGTNSEKRLIGELLSYFEEMTSMQDINSNWVYVAALGAGIHSGWSISWIDIVNKKHCYFYPIGGRSRGPKVPPNYLAFRYGGRLQSIHHVQGYEVFTDPNTIMPEIPSERWAPHFLYHLGPAFGPSGTVKTGQLHRGVRVWCALDTLLTSATISDARDESKARRETQGN